MIEDFIVGKRIVKVNILENTRGTRWEFIFPYNKDVIDIIKSLEGRKYHGFDLTDPRKIWSAPISERNRFTLDYYTGKAVYLPYDMALLPTPVSKHTDRMPLYKHQEVQIQHIITRKRCIIAADMGTGKTRSFIEAAESLGYSHDDIWYIGPKSGIKAVELDLVKWKTDICPVMMTYEGLVKKLKDWDDGEPAPKMLVFDESSKLKTPTSQRSQAAKHVTTWVRAFDGYIILMSGTPAPKSPIDWWHQAELACPGFLKESSKSELLRTLSILKDKESSAGGVFQEIVTWLDDANKCTECGQVSDIHDVVIDHEYKASINEVARLYKRLSGLTLVQLIDDCVDLPEITYQEVILKPKATTIRTANVIRVTATRAIEALTKLRQLSDGFQYTETADGTETCTSCSGTGVDYNPETKEPMECHHCEGKKVLTKYIRTVVDVPTPKDDALVEELEISEDIGRVIIWGGFTATVDKIVDICLSQGWVVLRVDGRGYHGLMRVSNYVKGYNDIPLDADTLLKAMDLTHPMRQELMDKYPLIAFVGQPQAGGMALTLTAARRMVYYSNDFSGEARLQSERRFRRLGMDAVAPITVVDFLHLASDRLVLDNLKAKRRLQDITLGEITSLEDVT